MQKDRSISPVFLSAERDSNPHSQKATDLQSADFAHLPFCRCCTLGRNRTYVTRLRVWSISPLLRRHLVSKAGVEPTLHNLKCNSEQGHLVGVVGFEPTQPKALVLQTSLTLQR